MDDKNLEQSLWDLKLNASAEIDSHDKNIESKFSTRLNELGFSKGAQVTCIKTTPFGGPRVYQMNGGVISLDKEIATSIILN